MLKQEFLERLRGSRSRAAARRRAARPARRDGRGGTGGRRRRFRRGGSRQRSDRERPIVVTYDLHGNHTPQRMQLANASIGYDTYPHVDMAERGREAGS